ncbi:MAG: NADH:ubiquinone oxidoreductase [Thermofilum sp. ex4484_82]|nr:MAG: NADH:ubiquinone oxidoreductase [Thermofilum sp. ex4484_82]OYT39835.1 MAG: NADH:ubiquinone oxidoreductase [Archaeoglobales archaeon ex4484_92]RLE76318.1 MAG: NADH:ubiquinone oxidoreductase [Thermoprotei archaeon]
MSVKKDKLKIGIFSLSSCEGCLVQMLNLEDYLLEIFENLSLVECRILGVKNGDEIDVAIVEGAVMSDDEEKRLAKIRQKSKILVAFGDCACHGGKFIVKDFDVEEIDTKLPRTGKFRAYPLDKYVKVDYYVFGCPVDKGEVLDLFKDLLLGRIHVSKSYNVCAECILRENACLLDLGIPCLGPITRGGCKAACPSVGRECIGCRGLAEDANIESLISIMKEKGIEIPEYLYNLQKYARGGST